MTIELKSKGNTPVGRPQMLDRPSVEGRKNMDSSDGLESIGGQRWKLLISHLTQDKRNTFLCALNITVK
jgi:hypothetical protein